MSIRTSTGAVPPLLRNIGATFHAQADGWHNTDLGVSCGDQFFKDGPNCQRDVLTHEWFHLVSVNRGAGRNAKGAVITVPRRQQSLRNDRGGAQALGLRPAHGHKPN